MRRCAIAIVLALLLLAAPGVTGADTPGDALVRAYVALGGRGALGPINGTAFRRGDESFLYLASSRAILQMPLGGGEAVPANVMDWFTVAGKDPWLEVVRGVPPPLVGADSEAVDRAPTGRRALLTEPAIAAFFDEPGEQRALMLFGQPTSRPRRYGPFVSQRFQRAVLQLWVDAVPGQPEPGSVVQVLAGDLLVEAGLLPGTHRRLPAGVGAGDVLERAPSTDAVAITFDMGSIDVGLPGILDALESRGLHATFFVTGDFVRHYEWALPRLLAAGHEIANHTVTHPDLTRMSNARAAREIDTLDAMLAVRGVTQPLWFRPPFGAWDRRIQTILSGRGYPIVMWRFDLGDWRDDVSVGDVIRFGQRIRAGDVVVTHGGLAKTAAAMPTVLDQLAGRGLRMVTLSDLYAGR